MKYEVFRTPREQAMGLHKYRDRIPRKTVFYFPNIRADWIETVGFKEPIKVYFLDSSKNPIATSELASSGRNWKALDAYQVLLNPDGILPVPAGAVDLIEASFFTDLSLFMKDALRT